MQTTQSFSARGPADPAAGALRAVLLGGLLAGALDLTFAFVFYGSHGVMPVPILQGIAGGVLGRGSAQMGLTSAALGAFFHFFISVCAAAIYYLVSLRVAFLTRRPVIAGAIFGVLMFVAMRFVVLPLSAIGYHPMKLGNAVGELCSHMFLFGMVIAQAVARAHVQNRFSR